jgi:hypothetical protein
MVVSLFSSNKLEMNKVMGIWSASAPAGGTAGFFLGGIMTFSLFFSLLKVSDSTFTRNIQKLF